MCSYSIVADTSQSCADPHSTFSTVADFQNPCRSDAAKSEAETTERLPGLKYPYAAFKSPFTNASQRACARSFTIDSALRGETAAQPDNTTARTPITDRFKALITLRFQGRNSTGSVERLFKLILPVKQIRNFFTTLCCIYNTYSGFARQPLERKGGNSAVASPEPTCFGAAEGGSEGPARGAADRPVWATHPPGRAVSGGTPR
jgi:hypothetical protein